MKIQNEIVHTQVLSGRTLFTLFKRFFFSSKFIITLYRNKKGLLFYPATCSGKQEALLHSILNLGRRSVAKDMPSTQNADLEVTQASLAHISLPNMSHVDTFNFKSSESVMAQQDGSEILVRGCASSIEYVEKYERMNVSDISEQ